MGEWRKTTAKVLNHLRSVFDDKALKNATEQEQAAVKRVWAFIGVKMREYYDDCPSFQWGKVAVDRRDGVRQQLLTRFPKEAFLDDESGKRARNKFTRADLLAWGDQLIAEDAANAALTDAELEEEALRLFAPEEHEGDEAAEAAPASAAAAANVNPDTAAEPAEAPPSISSANAAVATAAEAAVTMNLERNSQVAESSRAALELLFAMETSSVPSLRATDNSPGMGHLPSKSLTQHPAPSNTQGVRHYSPAYSLTPLPPLFNFSDAMSMVGGGAKEQLGTAIINGSLRTSPNLPPAVSGVLPDLSRKRRSDRPGSSPNRSPDLSSVVSDLSNLSCLDNVQLCRAVANGSIQLDDERPRTRKELLRRAAKREVKRRRSARAQEDIDQANKNIRKQLRIACQEGHIDKARLLLDQGAEVDGATDDGVTPLIAACWRGHVDAALLLLDNGAEVNRAMNDGRMPLHIACQKGHVETARLVLDRGAVVDRTEKGGRTPLHIACQKGHVETARLVLDRGADVDRADKEDETPLLVACEKGHVEMARLLLEKGADINRENDQGATPLDISMFRYCDAIVALLEEHQKCPPPGPRQ